MKETVIMIENIFDYIDKYGAGTVGFTNKERTIFVNHHDKEQLFSIGWMNDNKINTTILDEEKFFKMLNSGKWEQTNQ